LVRADVARKQLEAEVPATLPVPSVPSPEHGGEEPTSEPVSDAKPRRFHGTIQLDPERVGRDAGRIAEEVIAHLAGQVDAKVTVTLEIEAHLPNGAGDQIVRTVTENSRTLKFTSHGFEKE
jgi:hypothetical protein